MEVDVIILPKDGSKQELQLGMKQAIKNVFKKGEKYVMFGKIT